MLIKYAISFHFAALLLVFLWSGKAQASALNDCIDACFSGFSCTTREANGISLHDCQDGRQRCVEQCNRNTGRNEVSLPPTGIYGAIAYDKKADAWGMADTSQDKKSAQKTALAYCKLHGDHCEIVESFTKKCAAIAAGTGNRVGWAIDDSPRQAGLDAIKKCGVKNASDDRCFLQLYHCYLQ